MLVVDDSPSMRGFQSTWAANVGAFVEALGAEDTLVDLRVAVTTTSVAGSACEGAGGEPLVDSCLAHLDDFVGPDEHGEHGGGELDLAELCTGACNLTTIPRVPSPGSDDGDHSQLAIRPWLESSFNPFGGNLDEVGLVEALTCVGMRGFGGCRYESPIEAAARMVEHMSDPQHPMAAFRRPEAALAFVVVTDEDDCSHDAAAAEQLGLDGDGPSAICVEASVDCDEGGCALIDPSALASPDRLTEALVAAGESDAIVLALGGVTDVGTLDYDPEPDDPAAAAYALAFGMGPGCVGADGRMAAPPGRIAELVEASQSICSDDWSPILAPFVGWGGPQIAPVCVGLECVDDCVFEAVDREGERVALPQCGPQFEVPAGADACWSLPTEVDEIAPECVDAEASGELFVARAAGRYLPYDSVYELRCAPCADD